MDRDVGMVVWQVPCERIREEGEWKEKMKKKIQKIEVLWVLHYFAHQVNPFYQMIHQNRFSSTTKSVFEPKPIKGDTPVKLSFNEEALNATGIHIFISYVMY